MEVNLNKLTAQATEDFIIRLFDDQPVSRNVLDILISRTDGIPLFIEELVGMLKQKALVSVIEGEINFVSPDKLDQVPSSLRESLQQKLDSLIHAKETAQLAATIGREFEYDLLVAASSLSENQIQNDLNELIANDLIIQQRRVSSDSYIFKHALVRDAAYESMNLSMLAANHQFIAQTTVDIFPGKADQYPIVIAEHFGKGKSYQKAIDYTIKAIKLSISQSMEHTATQYYNNATYWNSYITEGFEKESNEVNIGAVIIPCLMVSQSYASEKLITIANSCENIIIKQKRELSTEDKETYYSLLWAAFLIKNNRSSRTETLNTIRDIINFSKNHKIKYQILFSNVIYGYYLWNIGSYYQAIEILNSTIKKLELENYTKKHFVLKYGLDAISYATAIKGLACVAIGDTDSANKAILASRGRAKEIGHAGNLSYTNTCQAILSQHLGSNKNVIELMDEQREIDKKYGPQFVGSLILIPYESAINNPENSNTLLDNLWNSGITHWSPMLESINIKTLIKNKKFHDAELRLKNIEYQIYEFGETGYEAHYLMLKAIIKSHQEKNEESNKLFKLSISKAKSINAYFQMLECALYYFTYGTENTRNESRETLESTLGLLPENHKSDLHKQAKSLLNH
ncbi:ATP-binding protein [Pseudoalteromonas citrea]|nr:hypothetical protein [Pseudoalteromonas citrea]